MRKIAFKLLRDAQNFKNLFCMKLLQLKATLNAFDVESAVPERGGKSQTLMTFKS